MKPETRTHKIIKVIFSDTYPIVTSQVYCQNEINGEIAITAIKKALHDAFIHKAHTITVDDFDLFNY